MRQRFTRNILRSIFLLCAFLLPLSIQGQNLDSPVMFNVQTHKYYHPSCVWAQRCTKNCVLVTKAEAVRRGGVACKVCGG